MNVTRFELLFKKSTINSLTILYYIMKYFLTGHFLLFALIFFSSCTSSENFIKDNIKNTSSFEAREYTSHFWVDDAGFYYQDFDENIKNYYPSFESENIHIINQKFFVYNKTLYSDYRILEWLSDDLINKVYNWLDINELNLVGDSILYDDQKIYTVFPSDWIIPNILEIWQGIFDTDNEMLLKGNKIYCFNETGYFERDLDSYDEVENEGNIYLLRNDASSNAYTNYPSIDLYIWCNKFIPTLVSESEIFPWNSLEILKDVNISDIEVISELYIKIWGKLYFNERAQMMQGEAWFWQTIDWATFQSLWGNFYSDKDSVFYMSKKLYWLLPDKINVVSDGVITDWETSYYKMWEIDNPEYKIEDLWDNYFKNVNDIYARTLNWKAKLEIDSSSYQIVWNSIIKDNNVVYFGSKKTDLNPDTLKLFNWGYYWDDKKIFLWMIQIEWVNPSTFETFPFAKHIAKDDKNIYYWTDKLTSVDAESFEVLGYYFWKDKNNLYFLWGGIELIHSIKAENEVEFISSTSIQYEDKLYTVELWRTLLINWEYQLLDEVD